MARKEKQSNRWIKTDRIGSVTLFLTKRSPFWWMHWTEGEPSEPEYVFPGRHRGRSCTMSTRETDLSLARLAAAKKNEELFRRERLHERDQAPSRKDPIEAVVADFIRYLHNIGRTHDYVRNIKARLGRLAAWMQKQKLTNVQDVTSRLLTHFRDHLKATRAVKSATVNDYLDAVHSLFGYVIFKRKLMPGPNPAATGRQAELDRLPDQTVAPPTIYPDQVNAIIARAVEKLDRQIVNMIVFICEGGFRFQELQFLQVGDVHLEAREIILDVKRPDPKRVRPELRRRCLTADDLWIPKSRAGRRPVHITDRLLRVIRTMGLGDPSDWLFVNEAGNQIAENKTLAKLKRYALEAKVFVQTHPKTGRPCSLMKWHWLRHFHRTRAHVCRIRREVSKVAMGHAADPIHDRYRGLDVFAFHEEYAKFDSGIDDELLANQ